jgi:hypothetical protein
MDGNQRKGMGDMIVHGVRALPDSELHRLMVQAITHGAVATYDMLLREHCRRALERFRDQDFVA